MDSALAHAFCRGYVGAGLQPGVAIRRVSVSNAAVSKLSKSARDLLVPLKIVIDIVNKI
jgi:hypothetical protein